MRSRFRALNAYPRGQVFGTSAESATSAGAQARRSISLCSANATGHPAPAGEPRKQPTKQLQNMTMKDLRKLAESRDISPNGKKVDLVARIQKIEAARAGMAQLQLVKL